MRVIAFFLGLTILFFSDHYAVRGLRREIASFGYRVIRKIAPVSNIFS